jgi:hypothetical protein
VWIVVQNQGVNAVSFVGASKSVEVRYGSDMTHQLIVGELIVRPHYIIASNHFRGTGLGALLTTAFDLQDWLNDGRILADPLIRLKAYARGTLTLA